jgi:hypothetical protein
VQQDGFFERGHLLRGEGTETPFETGEVERPDLFGLRL